MKLVPHDKPMTGGAILKITDLVTVDDYRPKRGMDCLIAKHSLPGSYPRRSAASCSTHKD